MKFYSSVRLQVTQTEKLEVKKDKEEKGKRGKKDYYGISVRVDVKKNKVAPPFKTAEFDILFYEEGGVDQVGAMLNWLKDNNLIGGGPGYYEIEGKNRRFQEAREILLEDPDLFEELFELCYTIE